MLKMCITADVQTDRNTNILERCVIKEGWDDAAGGMRSLLSMVPLLPPVSPPPSSSSHCSSIPFTDRLRLVQMLLSRRGKLLACTPPPLALALALALAAATSPMSKDWLLLGGRGSSMSSLLSRESSVRPSRGSLSVGSFPPGVVGAPGDPAAVGGVRGGPGLLAAAPRPPAAPPPPRSSSELKAPSRWSRLGRARAGAARQMPASVLLGLRGRGCDPPPLPPARGSVPPDDDTADEEEEEEEVVRLLCRDPQRNSTPSSCTHTRVCSTASGGRGSGAAGEGDGDGEGRPCGSGTPLRPSRPPLLWERLTTPAPPPPPPAALSLSTATASTSPRSPGVREGWGSVAL
ncbi:hypothetical protein CRUP_035115 [Coryphaenoides rupestris]|nr:hypothetical protein CRUP_035115 [Coryphaenoides rupestris]